MTTPLSPLRSIPQVDAILRTARETSQLAQYSDSQITTTAREVLDELRKSILGTPLPPLSKGGGGEAAGGFDGRVNPAPTMEYIITEIIRKLAESSVHSLRPVINGTGIVLHTNLGRAVMPECVAELVKQTAMEYSTLEYDVETGSRGSRHSHVEQLMCKLTGAESAMVVNNNAAAVMLALSALCKGREAVVSRGELVEVGGSFRIPEVMEQSGAILREVGSTNKTHMGDYARAINENTAALLKVHTSNYRIVGFTAEVEIAEMVQLGREHSVPVIYDVGSGDLVGAGFTRPPKETKTADGRVDPAPTIAEPTVRDGVVAGADVICFSGDKLLGGPQAGIIIGRADLIAKLKSHPLARAVRIDKLSLVALEGTLRLYLDPATAEKIPTLAMLSASADQLKERATELVAMLPPLSGLEYSVEQTMGEVGGGSLPGQQLPSWAVAVRCVGCDDPGTPLISNPLNIVILEQYLRCRNLPIIGRITRDTYLLDIRCIAERHFEEIVEAFGEVENV